MNVQFHGFQTCAESRPQPDGRSHAGRYRTNEPARELRTGHDFGCVGFLRALPQRRPERHCQEFGLSATRKFNALKLTIGGAYSKENFYRATTGAVSLSRDLANGNTTVAGGFSFSLNQPMLHPLPEYENQYQSGAFLSVTQTLTKSTIAQGGYELCISSAIRTIRTCARTSTE